jgi:hypothetical protein
LVWSSELVSELLTGTVKLPIQYGNEDVIIDVKVNSTAMLIGLSLLSTLSGFHTSVSIRPDLLHASSHLLRLLVINIKV